MGSTRGGEPPAAQGCFRNHTEKNWWTPAARKAGRAAEVVCVVEQQDAAQSAGSAGTQDPALRRTALEQETARRRDSWASNRRQAGEHGKFVAPEDFGDPRSI